MNIIVPKDSSLDECARMQLIGYFHYHSVYPLLLSLFRIIYHRYLPFKMILFHIILTLLFITIIQTILISLQLVFQSPRDHLGKKCKTFCRTRLLHNWKYCMLIDNLWFSWLFGAHRVEISDIGKVPFRRQVFRKLAFSWFSFISYCKR